MNRPPVKRVRFIRVDENNKVIETNGSTDIGAFMLMKEQRSGYIVLAVDVPYPQIGDEVPSEQP